jgi:hypothetical protein
MHMQSQARWSSAYCNPTNVMLAVDLKNMFDAGGWDALVDELFRHGKQ